MLKFIDVFGRWDAAESNQLEAAGLLGIGERRGGFAQPPDRQSLGQACSGRPMRRSRTSVSGALPRLRGAAFPRASGPLPPVCLELQLDEDFPAKPEPAGEGGTPWRAPSQAASSSFARHDGASGRLAARVADRGSRIAAYSPQTRGQDGRAFVTVPGLDLAEVLCVQESFLIAADESKEVLPTDDGSPILPGMMHSKHSLLHDPQFSRK